VDVRERLVLLLLAGRALREARVKAGALELETRAVTVNVDRQAKVATDVQLAEELEV